MLLLAEWDEVSCLTFENFKLAIMLLVYEVWINLCSVFSSLDKVSAIGGFESPVSTHLFIFGCKIQVYLSDRALLQLGILMAEAVILCKVSAKFEV